METIKTYLDNMFATIPRGEQTQRLYNDLLATMEDKYNELKAEGKSENEAIGVVISEFGNIDELLQEMNIDRAASDAEADPLPCVDQQEAETFLTVKQSCGLLIAIGVFLCILSPAVYLFLAGLPHIGDAFALISLFVLVAVAVALFVYSGLRSERFKYMEKREFILAPGVEALVRQQQQDFAPTKAKLLVIGIVVIILSPAAFFLVDAMMHSARFVDSISAGLMLLFIAVGVFLLILAGSIDEAYKQLLQEGEFNVRKKRSRNNRVVGAVAAIWWPVITCVYLVYSFVTWNWHFSWIIWPVAGILFGAFSAAFATIRGENFHDDE